MHETLKKAICNKGFNCYSRILPAQTLVSVDRKVARNSLLLLHSTVMVERITPKTSTLQTIIR